MKLDGKTIGVRETVVQTTGFDEITITEIMMLLCIGERAAREKMKRWIEIGFLQPKDPDAQRVRSIILSDWYEELGDQIRENPHQLRYLLSKDELDQ